MSKLTQYIRDTRAEMQHVVWPTRKQATGFTILVVVISVLTAFFLGFFDYIFALVIEKFVI